MKLDADCDVDIIDVVDVNVVDIVVIDDMDTVKDMVVD